MTANVIARMPANTEGRDFVIGDIHGAYPLVRKAMNEVDFYPSRDRLFCVGDLIDRGPESGQVMRFLAQPFVHTVRGNHEAALLDLHDSLAEIDDAESRDSFFTYATGMNGMEWWRDVTVEAREYMLAAFRGLPYVIEVATAWGCIGIVHADIPEGMDWQSFCARLEAGDEEVRKVALWGRSRLQTDNDRGVSGIEQVFVGHTPLWNGPKQLGNVHHIDTGAVFGLIGKRPEGCLTIVEITGDVVKPRMIRP